MADEESGAGNPPEAGGRENPKAGKKPASKKSAGKKTAKKTASKPASVAPSTPAASEAASTPSVPPEAPPARPASPTAPASASSYGRSGSSDGDNMRSGFLALWGPATMLVFVVLIFRFMGDGDADRDVSAEGATQALLSSGTQSAGSAPAGSAGDLTQPESTAGPSEPDLSSPGALMDAIRSATPDQITAALEAARSAIRQSPKGSETPVTSAETSDAAAPDSAAAPPPPGGFDNPWAPTGSEPWVTDAEPPPPPSGQQAYSGQQPGYPPAMPPQGYGQYGWQPMPPPGYGPPPQGYPPPQGAYPQQQPYYWGQQAPYGGQPPYPPPPPGY